jgi:hypothetical protein
MIIILLLFYSFGLPAHGTQCLPVWQILAFEIPNLTMLSSSKPVQLHENVWFWPSRQSGCKWSRQGRNELNNSWAGPWPGLKSSLALADLPLPLPAPPHQCLVLTGQLSRPSLCPHTTFTPPDKQQQGRLRVIFPSLGLNLGLACNPWKWSYV